VRLFTAVALPDAVSRHLDAALGGIGGSLVADPGAGLRWTPRAQRHLTLAFHGNVPDGAVPGYIEELTWAMNEASVPPFEVALAGGGSFSGKTLWAGVGEGEKGLRKLSSIVEDAAAEAGLWPDNRAGSRPHVTLARASSNRGEAHRRSGRRNQRGRKPSDMGHDDEAPIANLDAWARALAIYRGPAFTVETIQVVHSELGKGPGSGPLHTDVAVIPLQANLAGDWDSLSSAYDLDDGETTNLAGRRLNYPLKTDLVDAHLY